MYIILVISVIVSAFDLIEAQSILANRTHCYEFTWLGPTYNDKNIFNASCQDATRRSSLLPCKLPLVATDDGTWPDIKHIWSNYGHNVTCVLADNDVCAQYTYYFNGRVENSTYMCVRAVDGNNTAVTGGCYEETKGSYSTKVCLCRSQPGRMPCNLAAISSLYPVLWFIFAILLIPSRFIL